LIIDPCVTAIQTDSSQHLGSYYWYAL